MAQPFRADGDDGRARLSRCFTEIDVRITPWLARIPYAPTLEGQYIIKNIVLIGAAMVVGATVRGGAIVADPQRSVPGNTPDQTGSLEP